MRIFNLLFLFLFLIPLVIAVLAPTAAAKPDFLKLRRKYHRLHCHQRRCVALHSRVPFP